MSSKGKYFSTMESELHCISILPIDVIWQRLEELQNGYFEVSITKISEDDAVFTIQSIGNKHRKLAGSLLRWNGTFTRIEANIVKKSVFDLSESDILLKLFGGLASILVVIGLIAFINAQVYAWFLWLFLIAGLAVLIPFFSPILFLAYKYIMTNSKQMQQSERKSNDKMLQAVADKLTEGLNEVDSLLEFDGTESSLANLLKRENYKQFRVSEDGEIE